MVANETNIHQRISNKRKKAYFCHSILIINLPSPYEKYSFGISKSIEYHKSYLYFTHMRYII